MWGPGAQGGFQNALSMGLQMGQMARRGQDQREYKNALAQFDPSNPETLKPIMAARPEVGIQLRGQIEAQAGARAQAQREAAKDRRADLPTVTRLLETSVDQESYTRNLGMAQQYGIDVSTLPQQFDPAWRDQQIGTMKMLQTPEGQEVLSTAGKQAFDEGFKPGTPEFQKRTNEIWQQSGAIPYTGENGETRLYVPGRGVPTQQAITEGTVIENDAGEKMILRNGKWEAVTGGGVSNGPGSF